MDKLNTIKIFLYENRKKLIIVIALLIVTLTMTLLFLNKNSYKTESLVYENVLEESNENIKEKQEKPEYYYVDVKGAVYVPGVYSLEKGKRVVDAINEAGGVLENGDTSLLNLSMELEDGMVIIVYTNDDVNKELNTSNSSSICNGKLVNNACITPNTNSITKPDAKSQTKDVSSKININTANLTELESLPKIGTAKAQAIIDYRTKNGSFKKIEDIKNVSGIGDAIFETLKDNITV